MSWQIKVNMSSDWKKIITWYKETLNIPEKLVELAADFEIVQLASTGASNDEISEILNMDVSDISSVLSSRVSDSFTGWETTLDFNPNAILMDILENSRNGITPIDDVAMDAYEKAVSKLCSKEIAEKSFLVARVSVLMDVELSFYFP